MASTIDARLSTLTTRLAVTTGATVLLAASCGATDDGTGGASASDPTDVAQPTDTATAEAPTGSDDPTATTTASPTPSETAAPTDDAPEPSSIDLPALDAECTIDPSGPEVDTIRYVVPSSWQVDGSCEFLDPELDELPEQTEAPASVIISVTDAAFGDLVAPGPELRDTTRWVGARANFQSVRIVGETTGVGLWPEGLTTMLWAVDLDTGTDETGGALLISTGALDGDASELARAVADSIAQTVIVRPPAEGPATSPGGTGFAVTRVEGGGAPHAVTYDGDCFALRPDGPTGDATDEVCDLDPTDGEIVAGVLGDDVLVGYTSPLAVAVSTPQLPGPYGIATAIEGSSLFAFEVDAEELPVRATAVRAGGGVIASADVG